MSFFVVLVVVLVVVFVVCGSVAASVSLVLLLVCVCVDLAGVYFGCVCLATCIRHYSYHVSSHE